MNFIYDIETIKCLFTAVVKCHETGERWVFEVSRRRDDSWSFIQFMLWLGRSDHSMIGFNNESFDYPVCHALIEAGTFTALDAWNQAQNIIGQQRFNRFGSTIWPDQRHVRQIDLYKINHFDNPAKSTSLKIIEFNLRSPHIGEMPHHHSSEYLTDEQIDETIRYNNHDVECTEAFFIECKPAIEFRESLNPDWINYSDSKLGKQIVIDALGAERCYTRENGKRQPRQTLRDSVALADVILPNVSFRLPEFQELHRFLAAQRITETKDVFSDVGADFRGIRYKIGTGGLHGSVERQVIRADEQTDIVDVDVASFYPNLGIRNRLFPAHLGEQFCDVYSDLYDKRAATPKSDPRNGALKLGLNSVYGDSNNPYGPFYDPAYTMAITINGQLQLLMLVEIISLYTGAEIIQANTDGITLRIAKSERAMLQQCLDVWQSHTQLTLESVSYDAMWIRDVNNYIARDVAGKVKRKGAYVVKPEWHKDHSALVVPKVAGDVMLDGADALQSLINWRDPFDFCLRIKTSAGSSLTTTDGATYGRVTRYHVALDGPQFVKTMPSGRVAAVEKDWFVNVCNDMRNFDWCNLELRYYLQQIQKLVIA